MDYDIFLRFIFPDGMFEYFTMTDFKECKEKVEIHFEEKNLIPDEYSDHQLESKGFLSAVKMHDFPMRGRTCVLYIKRRRWYNHTLCTYVARDWEAMAKGTQISSEFASFLKAMHRLSADQHK